MHADSSKHTYRFHDDTTVWANTVSKKGSEKETRDQRRQIRDGYVAMDYESLFQKCQKSKAACMC